MLSLVRGPSPAGDPWGLGAAAALKGARPQVMRTDLPGTTIFHPGPQPGEPDPPIRPWGTGHSWGWAGARDIAKVGNSCGEERLPQDSGQNGEGGSQCQGA